MKEHDATEFAFKNGYMQGVKYCKAEIDRLTAIEKSHQVLNGELRKEVERLTKENRHFADIGKFYSEIRAEARAEAIKEFWEKVKCSSEQTSLVCCGALVTIEYTITKKSLDQIAKEMGVEL